MVFEDVAGNFRTADANYKLMKAKYETETKEVQSKLNEKTKELKLSQINHEKAIKEMEKKYRDIIEKKDHEIAYETERKSYFHAKNKELEDKA